jgi:putative peptidoglycan lipid II flippase
LILPWSLGILYPGSAVSARDALFEACVWLIPYYFINGVSLLFYGALQARKVFWANAMLPGLFPVAILAALWLWPNVDIHVLLLGTVAGSAFESMVLHQLLRRAALLRWRHTEGSGLLRVSRLAMPLAAGAMVAAFAPVVEQLITYRLGEGAVSLLNYGFKVPAALGSLLVTAIGIVVLPHFAELISQKAWQPCRALYLRLCGIVLAVGLGVAGVGVVVSEPIVRLLFERGAFTSAHTIVAAAVMRMYLLQLPFLLVAMVSLRALAALDKTATMTGIATTQLILAGGLAYGLSHQMGVAGVALGTTIAALCGAGILGWVTWKAFSERTRGLVAA